MSTFLLVHGAWHSGRCWERVVPLLEAAGHRVFAPSLTGYGDKAHLLGPDVGLDTHVEDIVRLIGDEGLTEVTLVGHSYAGLVISSAANQIPDRIAHLVYLDAMVPEDGETAVDVHEAGGNVETVHGATLRELVQALNRMGLKPIGIIAILQAMKTAGALQAELVVQ